VHQFLAAKPVRVAQRKNKARGNLKFHPEIPWALPMTLVILALYWAYF